MAFSIPKDHRWSTRRPVDLDVTLQSDGHKPIVGRAHDISIGGMFVKTEAHQPITLTTDSSVILGFSMDHDEGTMHYRVPARVVRIALDGAGLMFEDYDAATLRSLRKVLHKSLENRTY